MTNSNSLIQGQPIEPGWRNPNHMQFSQRYGTINPMTSSSQHSSELSEGDINSPYFISKGYTNNNNNSQDKNIHSRERYIQELPAGYYINQTETYPTIPSYDQQSMSFQESSFHQSIPMNHTSIEVTEYSQNPHFEKPSHPISKIKPQRIPNNTNRGGSYQKPLENTYPSYYQDLYHDLDTKPKVGKFDDIHPTPTTASSKSNHHISKSQGFAMAKQLTGFPTYRIPQKSELSFQPKSQIQTSFRNQIRTASGQDRNGNFSNHKPNNPINYARGLPPNNFFQIVSSDPSGPSATENGNTRNFHPNSPSQIHNHNPVEKNNLLEHNHNQHGKYSNSQNGQYNEFFHSSGSKSTHGTADHPFDYKERQISNQQQQNPGVTRFLPASFHDSLTRTQSSQHSRKLHQPHTWHRSKTAHPSQIQVQPNNFSQHYGFSPSGEVSFQRTYFSPNGYTHNLAAGTGTSLNTQTPLSSSKASNWFQKRMSSARHRPRISQRIHSFSETEDFARNSETGYFPQPNQNLNGNDPISSFQQREMEMEIERKREMEQWEYDQKPYSSFRHPNKAHDSNFSHDFKSNQAQHSNGPNNPKISFPGSQTTKLRVANVGDAISNHMNQTRIQSSFKNNNNITDQSDLASLGSSNSTGSAYSMDPRYSQETSNPLSIHPSQPEPRNNQQSSPQHKPFSGRIGISTENNNTIDHLSRMSSHSENYQTLPKSRPILSSPRSYSINSPLNSTKTGNLVNHNSHNPRKKNIASTHHPSISQAIVKLGSEDWKEIVSSLKALESLSKDADYVALEMDPNCTEMVAALIKCIQNLRSSVCNQAITCTAGLIENAHQIFHKSHLSDLTNALLHKFSETSKFLAQEAGVTLTVMMNYISAEKCLPSLMVAATDNHPAIRSYAMYFIAVCCMELYSRSDLITFSDLKQLATIVITSMEGGSPKAREASKTALAIIFNSFTRNTKALVSLRHAFEKSFENIPIRLQNHSQLVSQDFINFLLEINPSYFKVATIIHNLFTFIDKFGNVLESMISFADPFLAKKGTRTRKSSVKTSRSKKSKTRSKDTLSSLSNVSQLKSVSKSMKRSQTSIGTKSSHKSKSSTSLTTTDSNSPKYSKSSSNLSRAGSSFSKQTSGKSKLKSKSTTSLSKHIKEIQAVMEKGTWNAKTETLQELVALVSSNSENIQERTIMFSIVHSLVLGIGDVNSRVSLLALENAPPILSSLQNSLEPSLSLLIPCLLRASASRNPVIQQRCLELFDLLIDILPAKSLLIHFSKLWVESNDRNQGPLLSKILSTLDHYDTETNEPREISSKHPIRKHVIPLAFSILKNSSKTQVRKENTKLIQKLSQYYSPGKFSDIASKYLKTDHDFRVFQKILT